MRRFKNGCFKKLIIITPFVKFLFIELIIPQNHKLCKETRNLSCLGRQKRLFTWRRRRDLKLLRNPSCGARKNPSGASALFLDFFDRCAHPCSLHRLRRAPRRGPRRIRRSGSNPVFPHKKTKAATLLDDCFFVLAQKEGFEPSRRLPDLLP